MDAHVARKKQPTWIFGVRRRTLVDADGEVDAIERTDRAAEIRRVDGGELDLHRAVARDHHHVVEVPPTHVPQAGRENEVRRTARAAKRAANLRLPARDRRVARVEQHAAAVVLALRHVDLDETACESRCTARVVRPNTDRRPVLELAKNVPSWRDEQLGQRDWVLLAVGEVLAVEDDPGRHPHWLVGIIGDPDIPECPRLVEQARYVAWVTDLRKRVDHVAVRHGAYPTAPCA